MLGRARALELVEGSKAVVHTSIASYSKTTMLSLEMLLSVLYPSLRMEDAFGCVQ